MRIDAFALSSMLSYLLVVALNWPMLRQSAKEERKTFALLTLGTLLAYASGSLWVFAFAWALTSLPFLLQWKGSSRSAAILTTTSTILMMVGALLEMRATDLADQRSAFGVIVLAALLRKGIVPFHHWMTASFEEGSLGVANLLFNGHLGGYAILRFAMPMAKQSGIEAQSLICILAIVTAVYTSFVALGARRPRQILALVSLSQAAFILAGIEDTNLEGVTGALLHWWVVALSTTLLLGVLQALESRSTEVRAEHAAGEPRFWAMRRGHRDWQCSSWWVLWRWLGYPELWALRQRTCFSWFAGVAPLGGLRAAFRYGSECHHHAAAVLSFVPWPSKEQNSGHCGCIAPRAMGVCRAAPAAGGGRLNAKLSGGFTASGRAGLGATGSALHAKTGRGR